MKVKLKSAEALVNQHIAQCSGGQRPLALSVATSWRDLLQKIGDKTFDVDTRFLFDDRIIAIPPADLHSSAITVTSDMAAEVIEDVRPRAVKCSTCATTFLNVSDERVGELCPNCGMGRVVRLNIRPLARAS